MKANLTSVLDNYIICIKVNGMFCANFEIHVHLSVGEIVK